MFMIGNEPLTILGIVVAAVALRFVPNCSAPMVTKMAQKPLLKPSSPQMKYIDSSLLFKGL